MTKDGGDEFNKYAIYQVKNIYEIWLIPECDKHIIKIGKARSSNNLYRFLYVIDERMKNSWKFKYLKHVIKKMVIKI